MRVVGNYDVLKVALMSQHAKKIEPILWTKWQLCSMLAMNRTFFARDKDSCVTGRLPRPEAEISEATGSLPDC